MVWQSLGQGDTPRGRTDYRGIRRERGSVPTVMKISELISPGALAALGLIAGLASASAADEKGDERVLFDFSEGGVGSEVEWRPVNDGVMGGLSEGDMRLENGKLNFAGVLIEYSTITMPFCLPTCDACISKLSKK